MNGEQIRAARALLGWTAADLAQKAGLPYVTVQRLDAAKGTVKGRYETVAAIRRAIEDAGVAFLDVGAAATGPGVSIMRETTQA